MLTIGWGFPAYRVSVHAGYAMMASQLTTAAHRTPFRMLMTWSDSSYLPAARNTLVWWANLNKCDWFLSTDADTFSANGEGISKMIHEADSRGAAVVAAPTKLRNRSGYNCEILRGDQEIQLGKEDFDGRMLPVDRIGTAFMAINLNWLREHMPYPWPDGHAWFDIVQHSGGAGDVVPVWEGEDYRFCDKVRAKGGLILADGRIEPFHANGGMAETLLMQQAGFIIEPIGPT